MIKHIVLWRLKDEAHGNTKAENARLIKDMLEALNGQIEGLIKLEVGINVLETPTSYDIALYSELDSLEALSFYSNHPKHQAVVPFIVEAVAARSSIDFEV